MSHQIDFPGAYLAYLGFLNVLFDWLFRFVPDIKEFNFLRRFLCLSYDLGIVHVNTVFRMFKSLLCFDLHHTSWRLDWNKSVMIKIEILILVVDNVVEVHRLRDLSINAKKMDIIALRTLICSTIVRHKFWLLNRVELWNIFQTIQVNFNVLLWLLFTQLIWTLLWVIRQTFFS